MEIVIDGSTLSLLLYAHISGTGNQMGFLLGHKSEDVQSRISDSQIHANDTKSYIYISSFVPWPTLRDLYSRDDSLNLNDIYKAHEEHEEEIVGWYSFRHQSSLRPSMKEAAIHHKLSAMDELSENQDFLFFLCTLSASSNLSTHSSNHAFMTHNLSTMKFKNVSTIVRNLGDTSRSDYQKPSMTFMIHSRQTQGLVDKSIKDFVKPTGEIDQVVKMKKFADSIGNRLGSLQMQVDKSETNIGHLESEVRHLRQRMAHLETKDMTHTFNKEKQRLKQEEEDNNRLKESLSETNEEEQMNKLLTDLGLSTDIASSLFSKPEERVRKMSQDQDNLISWEKMEVNPLYASTLNSNQASSLQPAQRGGIHSGSPLTEDIVAETSSSNTRVVKEVETAVKRNLVITKDSKEGMPSTSHSKPPVQDHFGFIDDFKSELNGRKATSSAKASQSLNHANVTVSVKSSAIHPPASSDSKSNQKEHFPSVHHYSDTHLSTDNAHLSSAANSNGSAQLEENESTSSQETPCTLSSSPVF